MKNKFKSYAPLVIFAFNRPDKLNALLESLEKNLEFKHSELIFYIDNVKLKSEKSLHNEVINVASKDWKCNSKIININESNVGLKKNIINGVNKTFKTHETGIFLEDDLIVSENFLYFMNKSLTKYKNNSNVMHISGYNYPFLIGKKTDSYFTTIMNCWGWSTWRDRWTNNRNFIENRISILENKRRRKFNAFGFEKDFESQLIRNDNKALKTWAIYWYQYIFLNDGLCLQPVKTLVKNNGMDGSGERKVNSNFYNSKINYKKVKNFPHNIKFLIFYKFQVIIFFIYKKFRKNFIKFLIF